MSEGRISITYLVNSDQFNQSIGQMKKNMQLCNQEIKNSAKEIDLYGSNIQTLTNKQKAIQQAIEQSKKIMSSYSDNIKKNKQALSDNTAELEKLAVKKKEANKAYKDAVKTYGEESDEAKKLKEALNDVSEEYNIMQSRVKGNEKAITTGTAQLEKQRGVLLDLQRQLKETNEELDKQTDGFVQASEKFASAGKKYEELGGKIGEIGGVVATAGASLMAAASGLAALGLEMDNSFAGLGGKVGATVEETEKLKEIALNLYENGFGESIDDCINDIVLLQQNIKGASDYTDEEKTKLLEYMNNIKSLFGATSEELTRTVNNMLQNGIVDSAEEAFDVITVGFQNGLNSGGDLLDVLYEYSPQFKKLGINGQNALELIKAGLDNGAYNADKMADAIKEFSIRAIDGSNTTIDAFNSMGFSAEEMMSKFGEGGDTARQAFDEVLVALKSIEDPVEQDRIAVELFGTMWEDSSKQAILAMADIGDGLGNVTGATEKAGKEINNSIGTKMESAVRKVKDNFAKLGQSLLPVLEQAAEGVDKLANFISKISPETVKAVAKFGAFAIAIGGVTKITGSLVTGLGKGMSAISGLLKLASNTKSMGSFAKALSSMGGEATGITSAFGTLSKAIGGFTLTGGLISAAVAGITALGVAFYNNQKEIEESEAKLAEMADCYDDFTGRIRTNESIWTEIFGKEYNISFGSDYKQALANTEADVAEWVEKLRGMQENINTLLNDTSKSDETKQKELEQMVQLVPESNNKEEHRQQFKSGLEEAGITGEAQEKYLNLWSEAYDEAQQVVDDGERKIAEIIRNNLDEDGNITEEGMKQIEQVRKDVQDEMAQVQSTDFDTMLATTESHLAQEEAIYKGAEKGTVEAIRNKYKSMNDERIKDLENEKKFIDERAGLSEQEKQALKDDVNNQINNINTIEQAQMASLNRRAMYDQEYAKQNGLAVQQINDNMWTVIDTNTGIETSFFETETAMQQYADSMGLQTSYVSDEFGNMHMVIQDAGGGIMAMLDSSATSFGFFGNEAWVAMQQVIDQAGVTQGTAEQKFAAICAAIDNGTLKAEEFGFTSSEEFKAAAREMVNAGGSADNLKGKINNLPKNTNVKVETKIEGESALDNLISKLGSFAGKVFTATAKVATKGIDAVSGLLGKKETGGTINESGVYNINEAGTELVDSFGTSTTSNYSLGSAVRGEYAYLEQGTKVTNALMTTQKMKSMVSSEVAAAVNMAVNGMKKEIIEALKVKDNGTNINVTMNNPNFVDKGSERANKNYISNIFNSKK